jgi:hypothetical protein
MRPQAWRKTVSSSNPQDALSRASKQQAYVVSQASVGCPDMVQHAAARDVPTVQSYTTQHTRDAQLMSTASAHRYHASAAVK